MPAFHENKEQDPAVLAAQHLLADIDAEEEAGGHFKCIKRKIQTFHSLCTR